MPPAKLQHDAELIASNIAELENSAEVVRFFRVHLGYDVDDEADQPLSTFKMDADDYLSVRVQKIKKIGTDPDKGIEIYLFEVRSVTAELIQKIAQKFREYVGNFLVVLTTKDYNTLDFVLLDKVRAESTSEKSQLRFVFRPRILTVNRRNPGVVALRVLKRFTCTEADDLYQWDKLRSAYSLAEWSEPDFNNRALFSDYYLKHRLTDAKLNPAWGQDVKRIGGEAIRLISGAREQLAGDNEAKTRAKLIEPLFTLMGFTFTIDKTPDSPAETPDYSLYAPDKTDKPLALALVYKWNRNLDSADPERDQDTPNENPGALVVSLLEKSQAPWVIVTNGKLWRLYSTTTSNKITNYYEIDLEEALFAPNREEAFKYWWLMFRREAFTGFLEKVLAESQDYAKQIGERLKDRIFKKIFGYFAGGFIQYLRDQGKADSEIDREVVFHATMTFLYRLMFVLYAESLELVPVKEENGYGLHSLKAIKTEIANVAGKLLDAADHSLTERYDTDSTAFYNRLRELFASIDKGNSAINLPVYNGGLFSAETEQGKFLDQNAIPDLYLAIGLDRLARDVDDKTFALVFIDFKSLGVRQLGSIYEGLLEFKLRIAEEKLVVIKDGKREIYMPYKQAVKDKKKFDDSDVKEPGDVYIANTKQERKATGSYYTPDYIVKYIVEHTVGPVLEEKFKALRSRLHDAQKRYRQHRDTVKGRGNDQSPELFWTRDDMQALADDCLNIRVLDPAMGSGHFLVEVVDYTSNRLIDFLNAWSENPVWALLERTRADIQREMERQGVSIDEGKLTRVVLLKRSVLKRCVYGVDLNQMAVELAKVSLWLDAFTLGAPLSFLDHHLKWGNSLIGAFDLSEVVAPGSKRWQLIVDAARRMVKASKYTDSTKSEVDLSKAEYEAASAELEDVKKYASVTIGAHFVAELDNYRKSKTNQHMVGRVASEAYKVSGEKLLADFFTASQAKANEKHFFHWKLEFPEVYVDIQTGDWREAAGFDAVVGNPPYIATSAIPEADRKYYRQSFATTAKELNTFALFTEKTIDLVREQGFCSYIVPDSFLHVSSYSRLRHLILSTCKIARLAEIPGGAFEDAVVGNSTVFVLNHTTNRAHFNLLQVKRLETSMSQRSHLKQPHECGSSVGYPGVTKTCRDQQGGV